MLHEYHAQMIIRDRERHLRQVSEHARLHREAVGAKPRRPRWAAVRAGARRTRRRTDLRPAYTLPRRTAVAIDARPVPRVDAALGMMRRCC